MSAGFESCDPFTVTGMFRIPVALVHMLKTTLHPPVLRTSKAPAPFRVGENVSGEALPASASEAFSTGFRMWEDG